MSWNLQQLSELLAEQEQYVVTEEEHCLLIANEDGMPG